MSNKTADKKTASASAASASAASSASPDVRIEVENFGPIRSGAVDLRPLTVFVGPSNTGKTYFATLVYALHRVFGGLEHPISRGFVYRFVEEMGRPILSRRSDPLSKEERESTLRKLTERGRPFKFSDLSKQIRKVITSALKKPDGSASHLTEELEYCFGFESITNLEGWDQKSKGMSISLNISAASGCLWQFHMKSSGASLEVDGKIEDFILTSDESKKNELAGDLSSSDVYYWEQFLGRLTKEPKTTYYLPASRGGIMQSQRVIVSAFLRNSTPRIHSLSEIPIRSGVMLDLLEHLILYGEDRGKGLPHLAQPFERETLLGRIRTRQSLPGGFPDFYYQPHGRKQEISLTRASSMVSELAPVALSLRGLVRKGDILIIDEPEAHLHPAAQTHIAKMLAQLIRADVRVLITTHSDWLLQEIGNLIREGELRGCRPESTPEQSAPPAWLRQEEVGAWLFREDGKTSSSQVDPIPFDLVEGIDPPGYEEVAETLYNRSIRLQNRLMEAADDDERT